MRGRTGSRIALLTLALAPFTHAGAAPGDPVAGQALFNARSCGQSGCHDGGPNDNHLNAASLELAQEINANPAGHLGGAAPWTPAFTIQPD